MCTVLLPEAGNQLQLTNILYHIISSYHIIHHIISYHIISYHIISYHIISYHIISYHIISYYIISYHIISYHIISYHIMSCHISYHIYHIITYHMQFNPKISHHRYDSPCPVITHIFLCSKIVTNHNYVVLVGRLLRGVSGK